MVLFARSDVLEAPCFRVPGTSHIRPKKANGDPIPVWGVECAPCENVRRGDPQWSTTRHRIPLTPDEEEESREAQRLAEAALRQQQLMLSRTAAEAAQAARLGGIEPQIDPDDIAITSESVGAGEAGSGPATDPADRSADYAGLTKADLRDLARDRGLPLGGTKDDLVARHVEWERQSAPV